jgi:hypothetical protein
MLYSYLILPTLFHGVSACDHFKESSLMNQPKHKKLGEKPQFEESRISKEQL